MRLDKYLKVSGSLSAGQWRTRPATRKSPGNGKEAKASLSVKPGDTIEIQFGGKAVRVEVLSVQETVKKEAAAEMYRYL